MRARGLSLIKSCVSGKEDERCRFLRGRLQRGAEWKVGGITYLARNFLEGLGNGRGFEEKEKEKGLRNQSSPDEDKNNSKSVSYSNYIHCHPIVDCLQHWRLSGGTLGGA